MLPYTKLLTGKSMTLAHDVRTTPGIDKIAYTEPGLSHYTERGLLAATEDDTVILNAPPDSDFYDYLRSIGLGTDNIIVLNTSDLVQDTILNDQYTRRKVRNRIPGRYNPYYSGAKDLACSQALGTSYSGSKPVVTQCLNNKVSFKELCKRVGIRVPEGTIYDKRINDNLEHHIEKAMQPTGKAIIRGAIGASGSSIFKILSDTDIIPIVMHVINDDEQQYLVEPLYEATDSPNSQWVVDENGEVKHYRTSYQIIDENFVHIGNISNGIFDPEVMQVSHKIVGIMRDMGFRNSLVGIDYINTDNGLLALEANPRVNGSTFAWNAMHILSSKNPKIVACMATKINTKPITFKELQQKTNHLAYKSRHGYIPYNWGSYQNTGELQVIILGSSEQELMDIRKDLETILKE